MSGGGRAFLLTRYAEGPPAPDLFRLAELPAAALGEGEVEVAVQYLSMDPFPRLRISGDAARAPQLPLGSVMIGRGVGVVTRSRYPGLEEGTLVAGELGWREVAVVAGEGLRRIDPTLGPAPLSLGVLGPSGLAAYLALLDLAAAKAGDVVAISAAAGAVGSTAAQIAKLKGCTVVGVAGGPAQIAFLRDQVGVDHAIDYETAPDLGAAVAAAAPKGVDVFLDLVGGPIYDAVLAHLAVHARVALVGTIADYNAAPGAQDLAPRPNYHLILKRARLMGFLVADYAARFPEVSNIMAAWVREGALAPFQSITEGFERTPHAFAALFSSGPVGKQVVKV